MLTVRLLGHARFELDGEPWVLRAPPKTIELLGYLVTHRAAPIARDYLASLLWPDDGADEARTKLRRHFHMIFSALPPTPAGTPYTVNTRHTTQWNGSADVTVDVVSFENASARHDYAAASAWYGGEFLESFYEEWILAERERLRNLQLQNLRASIRAKRSERDLSGALADIGRVFTIDPWREDTLRTEMLIRGELGDRGGALAAYRTFERRLREELDADPLPETRAVFERLLHNDSPVGDSAPAVSARRADAPQTRTLPFGGRDGEIETLQRAWASAASGAGTMVLIGGEAGAGKSRLAAELALRAESEGGRVFTGTTSPREAQPYEALIEAMREALPLVLATVHDATLFGSIAPIFPEVAARAEIVTALPTSKDEERLRFFDAALSIFSMLARQRPIVLILEDLHWAEAASFALIEYVARRISSRPILVIGTYREEEVRRTHGLRPMRRRLEDEGSLLNIALDRLTTPAIAAIAERALDGHDNLQSFAAELFAKTEGLPLFLDEAIRNPNGVASTERLNVESRMERLDDAERAMLEIAAVAGTGFAVDVVREASGWPEADVLGALDGLVGARFLREPRRKTRHDYVFAHHLIHGDVYARIDPLQRRRRHAAIARVLSELAGTLLAERSAEIARHYELAGQSEQASTAYARAAKRASEVYANEEALELIDRAIESSVDDVLIADMELLRLDVAWTVSRGDLADQAIASLRRLRKTPGQMFSFEDRRGEHASFRRRFHEYREAMQKSLEAAEASGDLLRISGALQGLGWSAARLGEYEKVDEYFSQALRAIPTEHPEAEITSWFLRSGNAFTMLRRRAAQSASAELLAAARRANERRIEAEALMRLAVSAVELGELDEAEQRLREADEIYAQMSTLRGRIWVTETAARLAQRRAQYDRAASLHAQADRFYREAGQLHSLLRVVNGWALVDLCIGDARAALRRLDDELDLVKDTADGWTAEWWLRRGMAYGALDDRAGAAGAYDRAIALIEALPESALYANTVAFAVLEALRAGDTQRARELGMRFAAIPPEALDCDDLPHLLYWAKALLATVSDVAAARVYWNGAIARYRQRIEPMSESEAAAYAAAPWNVRFLREAPTA